MMFTKPVLAAATLLLALGAHAADESSGAQPAAPAASEAAAGDGPKVVCAREMLVGSRIATRVCRTVDAQVDDANREKTRRLIHQGAPTGAQGVGGKTGG